MLKILLLLCLSLLASCLPKASELKFAESALNKESTTPSKTPSDDAAILAQLEGSELFKSSYMKMNAQGCFGCHTAGYAYGDYKSLKKEGDWITAGLVIPGNPTGSFLIQKLKNSKTSFSTMPVTGEMNAIDYNHLRSWITALKVNEAPKVVAGTIQTIALPLTIATLTASATDADGTIESYAWSKTSGPAVVLAGQTTNTLKLTNLVIGTYAFTVTVIDNQGATASTEFKVIVNPANNIAPTVSAGGDVALTLPMNMTVLTANALDTDGTIVSYKWLKTAGGTVNMVGDTTKTLTLSSLLEGSYTFTVSVKDDKGSVAEDSVIVKVNPQPITDPFKKAYNTMELNGCFACHTTGYASGDLKKLATEEDWIKAGLVVPGQPDNSLLIKKLKPFGGSISTMPPSGAITAAEYATIRDWVTKIKVIAPPVVNAGADQAIVLPVNTATLTATASTVEGTIVSYAWAKVSGADTVVLTGNNTAVLKLSGLTAGPYEFSVTATTSLGIKASDSVKLVVNVANNMSPTVNAGADVAITLPVNTAVLTANGLDSDGTIASYKWTKTAGGAVNIAGDLTKSLTLSGLLEGSYTFMVRVTDDKGAIAEDSVIVKVNPQPITDPFLKAYNTMELNGCFACHKAGYASGDFQQHLAEADWVKAGLVVPGQPDNSLLIKKLKPFGAPTSTMPPSGVISATEYAAIRDWVTKIKVIVPPVVNAGNDQTITLPLNTATLTATATTTDGTIASYSWVKTAGPDTVMLAGATTSVLKLSQLVVGAYDFTVTATTSLGGKSSDAVRVVVNAANNVAPSVNAGADVTITLPTSMTSLTALAMDTDGTIASYKWTKVSGPAATLSGDTMKTLALTGLVEGAYVFSVAVTDDKGSMAMDSVGVTVKPQLITDPFLKAYNVMETSGCFGCHTNGYIYGDFKKLVTQDDWVKAGLVSPTLPDESLLIHKLKNSGLASGTMPPAGMLSAEQYGYIRNWILNIPKPVVVVTPPTGTTDKYAITKQVMGIEQFLTQQKRLHMRSGSDNHIFVIMNNAYRNLWGGGCDFFASSMSGLRSNNEAKFDYPVKACETSWNNAKDNGPVGNFSIIKEGARMNLCEYFANSDEYMGEFYAKGIITGNTFNKDNAAKVFAYYYPELTFTDTIYNNFMNQAKIQYPGIATNNDLWWRTYLSTLCQSMYWEMP